ncbi:hypothetical protein [Actinophytocola sediminis]
MADGLVSSTPDPAVNPAKNPRRVGVPNHHQSTGSGENLMVVKKPEPSRPTVAPVSVDAVQALLTSRSHRFLSFDGQGRLMVRLDHLAVLVAEIVTEHTAALAEQLAAERDAADDAINELLRQVDEARTDRDPADTATVYESTEAFLALTNPGTVS